MNRPITPGAGPAAPPLLPILALLWLAGAAIRIPLLAVPPVIPLMHDDLHMSETQVGLLIGLPLVMFAIAAIPGSLLIARFGVLFVAISGLTITALAAAARSTAADVWMLYGFTVLTGFGIAITQPSLPTLVRAWTPARMWLSSTVYTNGMVVGAALPSALSIPLILPMLGGSWRLDILFWAAPGLVAALLYAFAAPRPRADKPAAAATPRRWWPDWRDPVIWLLGIALGTNNAMFFSTNAFLPDYLRSGGNGELIGAALGWLNFSQVIASFILLGLAERMQRKAWPFYVFGPITVLGLVGIVLGDGIWIVISAAVLGFASALSFLVTFGLPAILSPPEGVHRMASGMLTISYTIAVVTPVIAGALWDLTGIPWTTFVPLGICGACLTVFGTMLIVRSARQP